MPGRLLYKSDEDFYAAQQEKDRREKLAGMTPRQRQVDKEAREKLAQYKELRNPESLTNVAKGFDERVKKLKLTAGPEATQELKNLEKSIASTDIMANGRPVGSGVLLPKPGTHYRSDIGFPYPGIENKPIITDNNNIGETSEQNPLKINAETNLLSDQKPSAGNLYKTSGMSITPSNSFISNMNSMSGDISKQKADMEATFTQSDNKIRGSKSRMGLFGNYGKDVEIRKTYDPETNKITRSKFVDGEKVEKGKGFKGVRRAKRAGGFGRKRNK